jgi:hypothetical protein
MSQSTYVQTTRPAEIRETFVLSVQRILYVAAIHVKKIFQLFVAQYIQFQKFLVLLEIPDKHSPLTALIPLSH